MMSLSEQYHEQFHQMQQLFNQWKPFEQLYAIVELSKKLQIYHRHYLSQYFQNEILHENDEIFNLTVDEANTPKMVACRQSMPLEKILKILQLHLSLISNRHFTVELFDAYRDILLDLDSKLTQSHTSLYSTHQQIYSSAQQIYFFLQTSPHLKCLIPQMPNLVHLIQTKTLSSNNSPTDSETSISNQQQKLFSRYPMVSITPLMRQDVHDSGVDLTEVGMHPFLTAHRSYNHSSTSTKNRHILVAETVSAPPIPEQIHVHQPLTAVMSAPTSNMYSDYPPYRSARMRPTLTKSDEEEEESNETNPSSGTTENSTRINDSPVDQILSQQQQIPTEPTRLLRQYYSLRQRPVKTNIPTEDVSQYLDVDGNGIPTQNTFILPNTGMKDVPRWLKSLRLHKYDVFFSKMTYDEMMNLTMEKLKELRITEGACSKIIVNIKKLKDRSTVLQQTITDFENGDIDLTKFVQHLIDLMSTPIRAKPVDSHDENDDLPKLILEALDKTMKKLDPSASPDIANQLLGLFDRCYRHEAFTVPQRNSILQWRGRLSSSLQSLGLFEYKNIQAASYPLTQNSRRTNKLAAKSLRSNPSIGSVPLSAYASEPQHSFVSMVNSNPIRRPDRTQRLMASPSETISSTTTRTNTPGAYLATHQHQSLVRKASVNSYAENTNQNKTRLCKTMSDPHQMRFFTPMQTINSNTTGYHRMLAPTYSQQHQLLSAKASIEKENHDDEPSTNTHEEQQSNSIEDEQFYHRITDAAMSDDVDSHRVETIANPS